MPIYEFLKRFKTDESYHTHSSVGFPFGKYSIQGGDLDEFWNVYVDGIVTNDECVYLAENPCKEVPILVDVDLQLDVDQATSSYLYTDDQLETVVETYQRILRDILVDVKDEDLTCVVLEKDPYVVTKNGTKYIKNGFHLHFPHLFVDYTVPEVYVVPIAKERLSSLFAKNGNFIDANANKVHWLMYGSRKPNCQPYVVTRAYDYRMRKLVDIDDIMRAHFADETTIFTALSIIPNGRERKYYYKARTSVDTPIFEKYIKVRESRNEYERFFVADKLDEASKLLNLLGADRAANYMDWLTVGFCLHNISRGDDNGLILWITFSERCPEKFRESVCLYKWEKEMRDNRYTIATLHYFAKSDNLNAYNALINSKETDLLKEALSGTHHDMTRLMHLNYGNEFLFCVVKERWYRFYDHVWHLDEKGLDLLLKLSQCIVLDLEELKTSTKRSGGGGDDDNDDNNVKRINNLIYKCKTMSFKKNVLASCMELFKNKSFNNLLNKDKYLIAFKNGVYDFKTFTFREGKPEDYLSVTLPIDYDDKYSFDHPDVVEIENFFGKIFPDEDIRNYFVEQASKVFIGGNMDKVILFWTGNGNNGKTVTQKLFEKMLGDFAVKFSTTLLSGKKGQLGVAAPELARAANSRWAVMDEPDQNEHLNAGVLKQLTGNDSYFARDLFESGRESKEITPLFKLHMICNRLPVIKDGDQATWNRIRVIPFESKFVAECECADSEEQRMREKKFPMDKYFSEKMDKLTKPLAWYLIEKLKKLDLFDNKDPPQKVLVATNVYRQENDVYKQFIECRIDDAASDDKLPVSDVYVAFKQWIQDEFAQYAIPSKLVLKQRLSLYLGETVERGTKWEGFKLKANAMMIDDDYCA